MIKYSSKKFWSINIINLLFLINNLFFLFVTIRLKVKVLISIKMILASIIKIIKQY